MTLKVTEIEAKTILSKSQIQAYTINPYVGCQHACSYCYARFMKRMTGHREPWGEFVDVKINAPDLLRQEIRKKRKKGKVWISGVCDPYQPLEAKYRLTRQCLEILIENQWPIVIQTRSPLVLRDIDILTNASNLDLFKENPDVEVGFSIPTADDSIRKLFEPNAPSIGQRIEALERLHQAGIRTYAMVAPILPGAESLGELLNGKIDQMLLDRMNYHYADWAFKKYGLEEALSPSYFQKVEAALTAACRKFGIEGYSVTGS